MEEEIKNPIKNFFSRFNTVIFIVLLTILLIICIIILKNTISHTGTEELNATGINPNQTTFNEKIKNKINNLKTSDQNSGNQPLPNGRINPFFE